MVFFLCFAKIVKAERNTKKAGFFLLPRRILAYEKIVQAAFFSLPILSLYPILYKRRMQTRIPFDILASAFFHSSYC